MLKIAASLLIALTAVPAMAQSPENGLSFGGEVKLEYVDANSHTWAFDGDASMTWRSGGLLGFDASIDTTYLEDGSDFTNLWAAAVFATGSGEFAIGAPRPLVDSRRVMPRFSSSRLVDLGTSFFLGPLASTASASDHGLTSGITFVNTAGNLTFGGGFHHMNDGTNVDVMEGIMQYRSGSTTYFISGEFAKVDGPNARLLQIGALHDAERFDVGASFSQFEATDTTHAIRLHGSYDVMSSLTVRGDVLMVQDSSDLYSLSATYGMENGLFVEGGGTKNNAGTEVYDIGVGFKF